jgi:histidine triad (HIT) family protein
MVRRDWYCEDILSGKLVVQLVYEDDLVLAFHHPSPVAPIHVVVIPKSHVSSLLDAAALDGDLLSAMVRAIQATATSLDLLGEEGEPRPRGFYVRVNAAAPGVTPHMHWHFLGPGAGANWPGS